MFESQFYTLTRAFWWTADLVRWTAGYAEEGCGSLGHEELRSVLREVVSLVPGAAPEDADYLELSLDTADTAGTGSGAKELSWAQFSAFLEGAAERGLRAAKCGDGEKGLDPVR